MHLWEELESFGINHIVMGYWTLKTLVHNPRPTDHYAATLICQFEGYNQSLFIGFHVDAYDDFEKLFS